jgi:hypothetical protein
MVVPILNCLRHERISRFNAQLRASQEDFSDALWGSNHDLTRLFRENPLMAGFLEVRREVFQSKGLANGPHGKSCNNEVIKFHKQAAVTSSGVGSTPTWGRIRPINRSPQGSCRRQKSIFMVTN